LLAKSRESGGYPLARHALDVACAVEALLLGTALGRRLAALGGRESLTGAEVARLCVLGALHDIGKTNHRMQAVLRGEATGPGGHIAPLLALIEAAGDAAPLGREARAALRYEIVAGWFADTLDQDDDGCEAEPALGWRLALGHHGGLSRPKSVGDLRARWATRDGVDPIAAMGDLVERIAAWFPAAFDRATPPLPSTEAFAHAVAGLLILADRLASSEAAMAADPPPPPDPAEGRARLRAAVAHALGPAPAIDRLPDWSDLLGGGAPRPAQAAMDALAADPGGSLHLLEAPTGSGKTEAALRHYLRLRRAGVVDGLYFALPNRAAAAQLHDRLGRMLGAVHGAGGPPVRLAGPGSLAPEPAAAMERPALHSPDAEAAGAEGWPARHAGSFLAAPLAVGTVDQVLLGALDVRASHLRGVSALRPLLVVDEVHASTPYMLGLLEEVLSRLAAAGGHALLLSATLGAGARRRLMRPGDRATRRDTGDSSPDDDTRPRRAALWRAGDNAPVWADDGAIGDRRVALALDRPAPGTPAGDAGAAALAAFDPERVLTAARAGARVLIIRNTVTAALATQRALEAAAADDPGAPLLRVGGVGAESGVPAPHHSRFAPDDRRALDRALEAAFGKDAPAEGGIVAVATQTAEQSLDIDADLLLTDLCPADVLIQRLGRLHRHGDRRRPAGFETPVARLLCPETATLDALAADRKGRGRPRPGLVGLGTAGASVYEITAAAATLAALEPSRRAPSWRPARRPGRSCCPPAPPRSSRRRPTTPASRPSLGRGTAWPAGPDGTTSGPTGWA